MALGRPAIVGRGSLDLELSVVGQPDPIVVAWADDLWQAYSRERYGPDVHPFERFSIVARSNGALVGYAEGDIRGTALKLGRLVVSPPWRGHGIASHLLRAVERFALEHGCDCVRLETISGEEAAKLYSDRGFKVIADLADWRDDRKPIVRAQCCVVVARASISVQAARRSGARETFRPRGSD